MEGYLDRYLADIPDRVWLEYLWSHDRLCHRIEPELREQSAQAAAWIGISASRRIIAGHSAVSIKNLIEAAGCRIEKVQNDPLKQLRPYLFAEFEEPDRITVYEERVSNVQQLLDNLGVFSDNTLISSYNSSLAEQIILAHEFFHFLDYEGNLTDGISRIKITVFGKLKLHVRVSALSEIAAMAFARDLLALNVHPCILDLLLVHNGNFS
ncbi:hypothetical protein [Lacrimispora sp.]|uniref:hypothetical protein n=1 Tax=Lacrimispora sp. TaxID=2719234 RepID=UPI0028AFCBEC|nr:hypothetical protein [Lacrimispora sp.]